MVPSSKAGRGDCDMATCVAGVLADARTEGGLAAGGATCAKAGAAVNTDNATKMMDFCIGSPSCRGRNPIGMAVFGRSQILSGACPYRKTGVHFSGTCANRHLDAKPADNRPKGRQRP